MSPIWLRFRLRPAHAYRGPTSIRSVCGCAPLLDRPAGEYPTTGALPRREQEPADPCLRCIDLLRKRAA